MKQKMIALLILLISATSLRANFFNNLGNIVEETGEAAGRVVEGAGEVAGRAVEDTGDIVRGDNRTPRRYYRRVETTQPVVKRRGFFNNEPTQRRVYVKEIEETVVE